VDQARQRGIRRLIGTYLPTEKNKLVEDHYAKLGFTKVEDLPSGGTAWSLDVDAAQTVALPITIERIGFGAVEATEAA
jgi:predicted enzyme involved in methoxymalonyl-ACP biosynthesis